MPIRILFDGRNRGFTIALWTAFFLCFMCLLSTLTWTVSILGDANIGLQTSSMILAFNSIGGTIGVASAGWAMERLGGPRLLLASFVIGMLTILGMGQTLHYLPALGLFSGLTGLCIGGNTAGLIALAVERYPTTVRATGLGWGLATGRLGGAIGPVLMGVVAGAGTQPAIMFAVIAVPAALGAVAVVPLCRRGRSEDYAPIVVGAPPA